MMGFSFNGPNNDDDKIKRQYVKGVFRREYTHGEYRQKEVKKK